MKAITGLFWLILIGIPALSFGQAPEGYFFPATDDCRTALNEKNLTAHDIALHYNESGFASYQRGDIQEAAQYFFCAVTTDGTLAVARYNLACMYTLLRKKYGLFICDWTYLPEIREHLSVAINLNPAFRTEMINDPDFEVVHDYPFFRLLSLDPRSGLADILVQAGTWYGPRPGVFPASPEVLFFADGTVSISYFAIAGEGPPGFDEPVMGTYQILDGNELLIRLFGDREPTRATIHIRIEGQVIRELGIDLGNGSFLGLDDDPCGV